MRAIRIHEPSGVEGLRLEEVPSLTPGPGEVRIEVHAAGCNFPDTLMLKGVYQDKPTWPFTPGKEVAGIVMDVGAGVTGFAPGDRVMALVGHGGFAEEVTVIAGEVHKIPDEMDFMTAGGFALVYATSYIALQHHQIHLTPGEVLLVHGAGGGVGLTAVEIGKILGATVVACAGSDEKLALAAQYGADHLINYRTESIRDRVKALAGGADVVYDPVGGDAFTQSLRCINTDGRFAIVGFASGDIPQIPANYLLVKNVSVTGIAMSGYRLRQTELMRNMFPTLLEWWRAGRLKPHTSFQFPLARTGEALQTILDRRSTGKVVIQIRDTESGVTPSH
jgi:NADPH:quinone reductase